MPFGVLVTELKVVGFWPNTVVSNQDGYIQVLLPASYPFQLPLFQFSAEPKISGNFVWNKYHAMVYQIAVSGVTRLSALRIGGFPRHLLHFLRVYVDELVLGRDNPSRGSPSIFNRDGAMHGGEFGYERAIRANSIHNNPSPFSIQKGVNAASGSLGGIFRRIRRVPGGLRRIDQFRGLFLEPPQRAESNNYTTDTYANEDGIKAERGPVRPVFIYRHGGKFSNDYGLVVIGGFILLATIFSALTGWAFAKEWKWDGYCWIFSASAAVSGTLGIASACIGCLPWNWCKCLDDGEEHSRNQQFPHGVNVSQKLLTRPLFLYYTKSMANVLNTDKQIAIIGSLAEGSSIRVHSDPVTSPLLAVRAAIIQEFRDNAPDEA